MQELDPAVARVLASFTAIVEALTARHRWESSVMLRLAALTVAGMEPEDAVERVEAAAEALREGSTFWSPLRTALRYVLAGIVARRGLDGAAVAAAVPPTLDRFRRHRLPRSDHAAVIAAFLLVAEHGGAPPGDGVVARMAEIMAAWKRDHRWLTGANDLPLAALHALRDEPVADLARRVEGIYTELARRGLKRGEHLQTASQLLALAPWEGPEAADALARVGRAGADLGERPRRGLYDEAALVALAGGDTEAMVREIVAVREALTRARTSRGRRLIGPFSAGVLQLTSIATSLVLIAHAERLERHDVASDANALLAARAALAAQQAAAVAAAATVAATASTSSR